MRKIITFVGMLGMIIAVWYVTAIHPHWRRACAIDRTVAQLSSQLNVLRQELTSLRTNIEAWRSGSVARERKIRQELLLARPKDIIYTT